MYHNILIKLHPHYNLTTILRLPHLRQLSKMPMLIYISRHCIISLVSFLSPFEQVLNQWDKTVHMQCPFSLTESLLSLMGRNGHRGRIYVCNVYFPWPRPCSAIDKKRVQISVRIGVAVVALDSSTQAKWPKLCSRHVQMHFYSGRSFTLLFNALHKI